MSFKSSLDSDRFEGPALKSKVISSVAWLFGTRYIAQGISWVITILVARILSPNDYGLMGMAMIYIGLIDFINEFGVGSALIQKEELRGDELDSSFWLILSLSGLIFLASFYFATVIADFFKNEKLVLIIRILGVGFIINGIKIVPYNLMTRDLAFEKRSKAELISNISAAIITFLCALRGFGVWSLVIGHLSLNGILAGMVYMVFPWRPKLSFGFGKVSNILKFGTTVTGSRLLWYCYSRADIFIVGKVFGDRLLGYYALAQTLASAPIEKVTTILLQVMYPAFSKLQKDNELLRKYFLRTTNIVATITFPVLTGIFLFADDLVPLVLTRKWLPMVPFLKIFCLAGTISTISVICSPLLIAIGKPHLDFFFNLLRLIVMPIGFLVGARFGLIGVAYVWLTLYPLLFLVIAWITIKSIGLSVRAYARQLRNPVINTLLMAAAIVALQRIGFGTLHVIPKIILSCTIGVLVYICFSFIFDRTLIREIRESIVSAVKHRGEELA